MIPWILIAVAVLLIIFGVIAVMLSRGERREPDYYTFFIIGLTWLPLGSATGNNMFFIMGLAFMAIGLANKDKWKKERHDWSRMSEKQKKVIMVMLGLLTLALVVGVLVTFLVNNGMINF